jgi:hypothetical protein
MQRISLLGKADAQNIEIQLKGIKLRLPAITAVRPGMWWLHVCVRMLPLCRAGHWQL